MKSYNTMLRLKSLMQERGLRQVDILSLTKPYCEKYGVKFNKSDISQYLSGKTEPNQDKLAILGMALGVNEGWLMGYDVPMDRNHENRPSSESSIYELIEKHYGKTTTEAVSLYVQLDLEDQAEIRGEMKQMLKSDKYSTNKKVIGISQQKEKPDVIIGQIAAFGSGPADIPVDKEASQKLAALAKKKRDEKKGK